MSAEIDQVYRDTFGAGADFGKLDAEARARADKMVEQASQPQYVINNGQWVANPARADVDRLIAAGRFTPQLAQHLGVYASWKAGLSPDVPGQGKLSELTMKLARKGGVPVDKLEKEVGDRKAQLSDWAKSTMNRFAHLVPQDPKKADVKDKAELEMPVEEVVAAPPPTQAASPPSPAATPSPMPQSPPPQVEPMANQDQTPEAPLTPPGPPTNWTKQQLVNGQYVPME